MQEQHGAERMSPTPKAKAEEFVMED